jgi:hypothetical protein
MIFAWRVCTLGLLITGWLLAALPLFAQAPAAESVQQKITIPGLRPPITAIQGGSQNLGDIKIVDEYPKPETFSFTVAQDFYYTDNVSYVHDNPQGSTAYIGSYTASYVPYSLRDWTPRITVQYNMFRYDTVPSGDFDNEQAIASSTYIFGDGRDWSWIAAVIGSRYTAPHQDDHEFYREIIYDNQVRRVIPLSSETPLSLVAGYDLEYHQTSPDVFDYLSNGLLVSLVYTPMNTVTMGPFINPSLRNFITNTASQNDREDAHLAEGFNVTWQPWTYAALQASIFHVNDFSNNSGLSFNYTLPGVSLGGEVKF